jgi:hypothetical protein
LHLLFTIKDQIQVFAGLDFHCFFRKVSLENWQLLFGPGFINRSKQVIILRSDLCDGVDYSCKILDKDVFAEWCVAIYKLSFLIELVGYFFELLEIKLYVAGCAFGELSFAERICVKFSLPTTILLNCFILYELLISENG